MSQFATAASRQADAVFVLVNDKIQKATYDREVAGASFRATRSGTPSAISYHQQTRHCRHKEDAIMKTLRNRFKTGVAATLLLTGLGTAVVAQGFVGGFSNGYIGGVRSPLQINGSVVCSACSLEEVQQAQPQEKDLYQFSHKNGQLVFK